MIITISGFTTIWLIMSRTAAIARARRSGGQAAIAIFLLVAGASRFAALWFNGAWRDGFKVRAADAIVWSQFALALAGVATVAAVSPSIPVYVVLTLGELWSCYRALIDEGGKRSG